MDLDIATTASVNGFNEYADGHFLNETLCYIPTEHAPVCIKGRLWRCPGTTLATTHGSPAYEV